MLSRKKRDAKFLIFQSLYLIAISILFYKGTDLSLNKVKAAEDSDTVIAKVLIREDSSVIRITKDSLNLLKKNNIFLDTSIDTIVSIGELEKLLAEANKKREIPPITKKQEESFVPPPPEKKEGKKEESTSLTEESKITKDTYKTYSNKTTNSIRIIFADGKKIGQIEPNESKSFLILGSYKKITDTYIPK